jgi:tetratricopeptide (TPR) repeat protein
MAADSLQQLIAEKKYTQAVQTGEQLLQQNPKQPGTRFLTAYANQMAGNSQRAVQLYEELIRDKPGLPEPRNNLAMIYLAQGDYDRASELLVSAINTRISYAIAYANLSQVYKGIASEAYRRAISQSDEPASYTHDIELTAITWLGSQEAEELPQLAAVSVSKPAAVEPVAKPEAATKPLESAANAKQNEAAPTLVDNANQDTLLIEQVRNWAKAWSSKDFDNYLTSYAPAYRAEFDTHSQWVEHRRDRILRPGAIRVEVSDFVIKRRTDNRASVDFTQAFSSPGYSDRVLKRLDFERVGAQWKIAAERVLSVL